jgi:hypothetical protein
MRSIQLCAAAAVLLLAGVSLASEKWDSKDPSKWSSAEIDKLLHNSPWAQPAKVQLSPAQNRGPNSGQGGNPDDQSGYPGGGGRRSGGMGVPGLGFPFPGGGGMGYPGGGRGGRGGGNRRPADQTANAIVRWESALPMRLADAQENPPSKEQQGELKPRPADDATATGPAGGFKKADAPAPAAAAASEHPSVTTLTPNETPKEYIIAVSGFPLESQNRGYQRRDSDSDQNRDSSTQDDKDKNDNRYGRDPEAIREELMERTSISRAEGRTLRPVAVEFDLPGRYGIIYFYFSRENEITKKDKELTFHTQLGGNRLERKFEVKEMVYKGKLEL